MSVNSKQKGARFEREVANAFKAAGFTEARRSAQYCGNTGDAADVMGVPGLHIECKHYKDTEWKDEWYEQAKRDSIKKLPDIPVVIHKKDRGKPKVRLSMINLAAIASRYDGNPLAEVDLDDFIDMYVQYDAKRWRPSNEK